MRILIISWWQPPGTWEHVDDGKIFHGLDLQPSSILGAAETPNLCPESQAKIATFDTPVMASLVRIKPQSWFSSTGSPPVFRLDVFGVPCASSADCTCGAGQKLELVGNSVTCEPCPSGQWRAESEHTHRTCVTWTPLDMLECENFSYPQQGSATTDAHCQPCDTANEFCDILTFSLYRDGERLPFAGNPVQVVHTMELIHGATVDLIVKPRNGDGTYVISSPVGTHGLEIEQYPLPRGNYGWKLVGDIACGSGEDSVDECPVEKYFQVAVTDGQHALAVVSVTILVRAGFGSIDLVGYDDYSAIEVVDDTSFAATVSSGGDNVTYRYVAALTCKSELDAPLCCTQHHTGNSV